MESASTAFTLALRTALARWELPITPAQFEQFRAHFEAVVQANRTMNLTRIVEPAAAAVKHFADSLALCPWVRERGPKVESLLDIGTGAGFPALPLAIARPDWNVTAIDATRKKADFVAATAKAIGLSNVRVEHGHSRHWQSQRSFQFAVLRAVAQWPKALTVASRHIQPGGWAALYQTASAAAPQSRGTGAGEKIPRGFTLEEIHRYTLDLDGTPLARALYIFRRAGNYATLRDHAPLPSRGL